METKRFEGEVEPYCKWQYGEKCDILVAHLHGILSYPLTGERERSFHISFHLEIWHTLLF